MGNPPMPVGGRMGRDFLVWFLGSVLGVIGIGAVVLLVLLVVRVLGG